MKYFLTAALIFCILFIYACGQKTAKGEVQMLNANTKTIYLAGGCFWGMQKLMDSLKGVVNTTVGYANGNKEIKPDYKLVCTGTTGIKKL